MAESLAGRRVLVTAGPTYEDIDPVRYLANRSSGRMGFALAAAAAAAGAGVLLVTGPAACRTPPGAIERIDVRSARRMHEAVMERIGDCDLFIACAAVADYRPAVSYPEKIKKTGETMTLQLVRNPDILADVAGMKQPPYTVGFAAETEHLEQNARAKLEQKRLDLIAANSVACGLGFDARDNELLLLFADGRRLTIGPDTKERLARRLIGVLAAELSGHPLQEASHA